MASNQVRAKAIEPSDIILGLAGAERGFLCACLALFEDTSLSNRLGAWVDDAKAQVERAFDQDVPAEELESVQSRCEAWNGSDFKDDELRLALWIRVREAFDCEPSLSFSDRTACSAADDLVAAAISHADPISNGLSDSKSANSKSVTSLSDLVLPTISNLLEAALSSDNSGLPAADREKLIADVRKSLRALDPDVRDKLTKAVGSDELNDAAILKMLTLSGGLTTLSAAVGYSGFAAYILAAQASAFVPMVSGPMLVSILSVVSNPITAILGITVGTWWFAQSVNDRVRAEVATRVIALLALSGIAKHGRDTEGFLRACTSAQSLRPFGDLAHESIRKYRQLWESARQVGLPRNLSPRLKALMQRSIVASDRPGNRLRRLLFPGETGASDTALVAAMTVGDMLYTAASLDPRVLAAADFSRVEDIGTPIEFAMFARKVQQLSPEALSGVENNLTGYAAEQIVAAELIAKGHQVSLPERANQEGWDLNVDGQPFQVKCLAEPSALIRHFETYPDIPVLANSELFESVPEGFAD
ncbi:MAG: hypothetical protein KDI71_24445, partial [Xanthomonadales bacterium]|nr:hypothetical protein [Xanthomonadales bacterium]